MKGWAFFFVPKNATNKKKSTTIQTQPFCCAPASFPGGSTGGGAASWRPRSSYLGQAHSSPASTSASRRRAAPLEGREARRSGFRRLRAHRGRRQWETPEGHPPLPTLSLSPSPGKANLERWNKGETQPGRRTQVQGEEGGGAGPSRRRESILQPCRTLNVRFPRLQERLQRACRLGPFRGPGGPS